MQLGIIGLPQSGKTTIFNALTRGRQPVGTSGGRIEVRTAVVDVVDERVDQLARLFKPEKTTYAKVTYADFAGLESSSSKNSGARKVISGQLMNQLSQMDGFIHVVRCFENPTVPHPAGSIDHERDLMTMDEELALCDLIVVERKLERLAEERKKSVGRDKSAMERETDLFQRLKLALENDIPLRDLEMSPEEEKSLSGFGLLTLKPILVLLNLGDDQIPPQTNYPHRKSALLSLQGSLEMDLAQMNPEEARLYMVEYGIEELGLQKVIWKSYDLLGLHSFFTVGEDEVRAWTIRRGSTAWESAGAIHTDLQKGFIRAEVVEYDMLISLGSLVEARNRGCLRLEGKNYHVRDGEIVHVRFNI